MATLVQTEGLGMTRNWQYVKEKVSRAIQTKWFVGGTGLAVFAWTVIRGVPAWPLSMYGMNIVVFILIDLVTAFPYVWFIRNIVTGINSRPVWKLVLDSIGMGISFVAPYGYILWSTGEQIPTWVLAVVVAVIAAMAVLGPIRKITSALQSRVPS